MAGHAPYIMPDGKPLGYYLNLEKQPRAERQSRRNRGKYEIWAQLQQHKAGTVVDGELAELRALESVGHRRRRRWLNEKTLRDMAGSMTAADMESQFKPVPFGLDGPQSAFAEAMSPEHAALWEHFRNIDMDKEVLVLQRWAAHNKEQHQEQQQARRPQAGPEGGLTAAAAEALASWSNVGRSARAALKKANPHAVLELEMQVLELMEQLQVDPEAELLLDTPDGFARLLAHGLAEYHGLLSATRMDKGARQVVLYAKPVSPATAAAAAATPAAPASGQLGGLGQHGTDITCTDVITALQELGSQGFNQHSLRRYMRTHVHGINSDVNSDDFVMV